MKYVLARSTWKSVPEGSGIYAIACRHEAQIYIGSTFNFRDRFGKHLSKLIRKKHPNTDLQKLFDRKQVLFFRIIKRCGMIEMMRHEQEYLNRYMKKALNRVTTVRYYQRRKRKC